MSDGFTGVKLQEVRAQLGNFRDAVEKIGREYIEAFETFNNELHNSWASPNAVKCNSALQNLCSWSVVFLMDSDKLLQDALEAARTMAEKNGANLSYYPYVHVGMADLIKLEESLNGITGMNITFAKASLETFEAAVTKTLGDLEDLPLDFGLLDPAGTLLSAYQSRIELLKSNLSVNLGYLKSKMTTAFEEEELSITLGKETAQSELSAN